MPHDEKGRVGRDEQAARELEQIQRELEECGRRRKRAKEAYDDFLRARFAHTGNAAAPSTTHARLADRSGRVTVSVLARPQLQDSTGSAGDRHDSRATGQPDAPRVTPTQGRAEPHVVRPRRDKARQLVQWSTVALAVAAVTALAVYGALQRTKRPEADSQDRQQIQNAAPRPDARAAKTQAAGESPAGAPSPATSGSAPATQLQTGLVTIRPVWLRVIVDGQRVIEREVPAGASIPLSATQTIVVRAGDAGAVRVFVAGRDEGPVGRDGIAVTKAYAVKQ